MTLAIVAYIIIGAITFVFISYAAGQDAIYGKIAIWSVFWPIFWLVCLISYMQSFSTLN
jgi:hypothetical protein